MDVVLGSSQGSHKRIIRVSCRSESFSWWQRRTCKQIAKVNLTRSHTPSSLPLHKHLRFNITNTLMYVTHVTNSLLCLPSNNFFCKSGLKRIFFLTEVFIFPQATLILRLCGRVTWAKYLLSFVPLHMVQIPLVMGSQLRKIFELAKSS